MEYPLGEENVSDLDVVSASSSKPRPRGRPRIPKSWTQVLNVDAVDLADIKIKVIATDLLMASSVPDV